LLGATTALEPAVLTRHLDDLSLVASGQSQLPDLLLTEGLNLGRSPPAARGHDHLRGTDGLLERLCATLGDEPLTQSETVHVVLAAWLGVAGRLDHRLAGDVGRVRGQHLEHVHDVVRASQALELLPDPARPQLADGPGEGATGDNAGRGG